MAEPHPFRVAAETKDLELLREALAEDVVVHSPVLFRGFEGRDAAMVVLSNVIQVLENFAYTDELADGDTLVLRFRADVGDLQLEGIDFIRLGADGKVADLTVFMRPQRALTAFNERMGERLAAAGLTA
jgi:hypothetical protein